ncbi:hypothetical protein BDQ17DRAFT_1250489 [Cyathus striatus]|nr:hypothetical protein BDQ17DRAFT_1250489 [Cyathus striatus]
MISCCHAHACIIQLHESAQHLAVPTMQRGLKGHVIVFPQKPSQLAKVLPPLIDDVTSMIRVLFVGSQPPSSDWLRLKAKPLVVCHDKVHQALLWLKHNNPFYSDIEINYDRINNLQDNFVLPVHIEHVKENDGIEVLMSRYDNTESHVETPIDIDTFKNVVITDIEAHTPAHEKRAAAIRHVKEKGGSYIQIPHSSSPVNEFNNPLLLPMIYPSLFPYGIGGPENLQRRTSLSFQCHIKYFFQLHDRHFQQHYSFLFTTFNIIQRRKALLHTSFKVKKENFNWVASTLASVSPQAIQSVSARVNKGDYNTFCNNDEKRYLT